MRFRLTTGLFASLAALLAAGCAGPDEEGTARIGLIAQALPSELTHVLVETDTGFSTDLARAPSGAFTGTLLLPVGMHELTGRAFAGAELAGVSNPVPVDVQADAISQVTIQILDITGGYQPDFGPLLESLSHPTSTAAGTEVTFAASIVDPDGAPVFITWDDDCDDSTFTAPLSGITGWSKATPGTCRVTVRGSSAGLVAIQSFSIVVFPSAGEGAVDIIGEFVPAPILDLWLFGPDDQCVVEPYSSNASCPLQVASPDVFSVQSTVEWLSSDPGAVSLSDDCGGSFGVTSWDEAVLTANWLPPAEGGICRITMNAVNEQGVVGALTMAVAVQPGEPRQPTGEPQVVAHLYGTESDCTASSGQGKARCGPVSAGSIAQIEVAVTWDDTLPGRIEFASSCGGTFLDGDIHLPAGFAQQPWQAPDGPVSCCTIKVSAISLEGIVREAVFRLEVL